VLALCAAGVGYVLPYTGYNPVFRLDFILTILAFFFALLAIVLFQERRWLYTAGPAAVVCLTIAIFAEQIFGYMPVLRLDTACAAIAGLFAAFGLLSYLEKL